MPRHATSSMSPTEFKFLRDLMGFTQSDVAGYVGVSSPRVVASWDASRNPSQPAAQWITEQKEFFASNLQKTLNAALPTTIDEDGNSVVQLRRYTSDEQLHEAQPGYDLSLIHI